MTNTTPSNAAGNSSSSSDKRKRFLQYKYRYKRKNTNSSSTPNLPTTNSNNNPNAINNANNTPVESQPSRLGRSKNTTKINPIPRTFRPTILDEADLNPIQKQNLVKIVEYVELYHKDDLEHSIVHSNHTKEIRGGTKNHYTIRIQYDIALLLDIIESNSIQNSTSDLPQLIATACFKKLSQMTRQRIFTEFVEVIVCPKSLPYVHFDQQLSVKKFFQTEKLGSMVPFKCLVSNLALPEFYNHSYYYKCINDTCINQHTSHIVKIPVYGDYHVTKRSQNGELIERTLICDLKQLELFCKACNEVQEEIVAERISKIQQSGGLTVLNQDGCSFHTLHFLQRGSLSPDIEIGDYVEVICSLNSKIDLDSKKLTPIMHFDVELHNIRKIEFCFGNSLRKEVSMGTLKSKLNDDMTPFEFSQTIVSELCSNMLQNHVWRKLRLCLLLSLSSITELNSVDSQPVHILIVTDAYTPLLSRLISFTASLKRNTKWNELVLDGKPNPFVQISKDNQFDFHVQSAKDGVLTVPIDSLNPAKLKELKSSMISPNNIRTETTNN
ncbi:hypothetical protein BC833DRAFT_573645 [Globomyces pollinis-pini]|nr:hypothetical protein BC833DRAFT_573645 [Globomyces pollinis-pini]